LLSATDSQLRNVRILGCESTQNIDERLKQYVMPYANNLDGEDSPIPGTKADLPQRALYHFTSQIVSQTPKASTLEHTKLVEHSLAHVKQVKVPQRLKMTDDELVSTIIEFWNEANGKSAEMLKILRQKKGIACEQSRFGRLFKIAKRNKSKDGGTSARSITLRAIQTTQGNGVELFAFFIPGELITQIADISRIHRDDGDHLEGFQRKEIKRHVNSIVEYLDQEDVLFPNSITLALSPEIDFKFKSARGRDPEGSLETINAGTLSIPILEEGQRVAWIVDGQQRSLALAKAQRKGLNVPVVAFVASDLDTQREQFILVNKARPLPTRLINELLPEVDTHLPRDLATRKIPSALCTILNRDPESPFFRLIKQTSREDSETAVITDTAVVDMIRSSLSSALGILAQYKGLGSDPSDTEKMRKILLLYWGTVKEVFPDAWGRTPQESRLMHSAGIRAMGTLMDKIMVRAFSTTDPKLHIRESLKKIAPLCRWTEGVWDHIGLPWNEIQQTTRHVRLLSDVLTRLDYEMAIQRTLL
jgi:DGQHR domain-containing protein